jgi:hypothetical protein
MKMRKIIKSKKADISAPIITVLLIIASIAIATLVISWMYGIGITMSKQGNLIVVGTPVIQPAGTGQYTLYITLKNGGNVDVRILGFTLSGVTITISNVVLASSTTTTTTTLISGITIKAGETVQLRITFSASSLPSNNIQGLVQTDAGNIPFQAILQ